MANAPFEIEMAPLPSALLAFQMLLRIWFLNGNTTEHRDLGKQSSEETSLEKGYFLNFSSNKHLWSDHLS